MASIEFPRRSATAFRQAGRASAVRLVLTGIFGTLAGINLVGAVWSETGYVRAHLAAALLALYLLAEALLYLRRTDRLGLLSPALLCLLGHFTLCYLVGISVSVFDPWTIQRFELWLPELDVSLAHMLLLAVLAAFCLLRGYAMTQPLARRLRRTVGSSALLRRDLRPQFALALGLQFVFLGLVALALQLGIYGMVSTAEIRAQHLDILEFLRLATAAGTLSYFLILLRYFQRRTERRASPLFGGLCVLLMALHVFGGTLAGFKSLMVMPFVIAALAYFIATGRMPRAFVLLACLMLVLSYSVIEPYRAYLGRAGPESAASMSSALSALVTAIETRDDLSHYTDISRTEQIASRLDLSGMTTMAVDFVDSGGLVVEQRERFQESILLAPVLAYIPRAIWQNKPSFSPGVWFNQNVLGRWNDEVTSVGMGPIGFLYMTGGVVAVCLGFALWGAIGALIFDGLARSGAGGLIIFLSVANELVTIPTSFGPALTGILRMLLVAFLAQIIFLRPSGQFKIK